MPTPSPRRLLPWILASALLLVALAALAAGRVEWAKKTINERDDKSWKLEIALFLPKAPDVAHVPMKFEFQQLFYYERSMVDSPGSTGKLLERKVPIEHKQPLIETVDIGFMDPSSGETQARTKFSFKVTRAHGYEAGEYRVTIRDTRNGQVVGQPVTLVLAGENEIVDRRSMVFGQGDPPKKKQMRQVDGDGNVEGVDGGASTPSGVSEAGAEEPAAEEPAAEPTPAAEEPAAAPPPIKEKPGGCGCRTAGQSPGAAPGLVLVLGAAALGLRRQRRAA